MVVHLIYFREIISGSSKESIRTTLLFYASEILRCDIFPTGILRQLSAGLELALGCGIIVEPGLKPLRTIIDIRTGLKERLGMIAVNHVGVHCRSRAYFIVWSHPYRREHEKVRACR